jgi:hypothetical protein
MVNPIEGFSASRRPWGGGRSITPTYAADVIFCRAHNAACQYGLLFPPDTLRGPFAYAL